MSENSAKNSPTLNSLVVDLFHGNRQTGRHEQVTGACRSCLAKAPNLFCQELQRVLCWKTWRRCNNQTLPCINASE